MQLHVGHRKNMRASERSTVFPPVQCACPCLLSFENVYTYALCLIKRDDNGKVREREREGGKGEGAKGGGRGRWERGRGRKEREMGKSLDSGLLVFLLKVSY